MNYPDRDTSFWTDFIDGAGSSDEHSGALFEEIIALNRDRILSRLRSKHAVRSFKTNNRTPIVVRLAEGIKIARVFTRSKANADSDVEDIEAKVKALQALYSQLEAMEEKQAGSDDCHDILRNLVKVAHSLSSQHDLSDLLNSIPNSGTFGPDAKTSLPEIVGKLGRYYSSCAFLIEASRKLSIFKSIQVACIESPAPVCLPSSIRTSKPSLLGTLGRITGTDAQTLRRMSIRSSNMTHFIDHTSAEANFLTFWGAPRGSFKVHAEIQLLFFYELHTEKPKPRVICSSKSACFLCNLFIKLHGKYYVARTHGVLYEKWSLPDFQAVGLQVPEAIAMIAVVKQFNKSIEDSIKSALAMPRLLRFHPNESVFTEPPTWSPSAVSLATSTASQVALPFDPPRSLTDPPDQIPHAIPSDETLSQLSFGRESHVAKPGDPAEPSSRRPTPEKDGIDPRDISSVRNYGAEGHGQSQLDLEMSGYVSPIRQRSSRNNLQDTASQQCSRSGGPIHCLDSSGPVRRPDAVAPSYQLQKPGDWIEQTLPTDESPMVVSTRNIRLILSHDWAEKTNQAVSSGYLVTKQNCANSEKQYLLRVRWLESEEDPRKLGETGLNMVDVDDMSENVDEAMSHEAESPLRLYLYRHDHIISVEYVKKGITDSF